MSRILDDERKSLILSEVLCEVGVNERMVKVRRKCTLIEESMYQLAGEVTDDPTKVYMFGSQSEGSTTLGFKSDTDCLICVTNVHVIQDWADWRQGVDNLLIVQDESTSPGYCLLQVLRDDVPLGTAYALDDDNITDNKGRVIIKNTQFADVNVVLGSQQNGPAFTIEAMNGRASIDGVPAFYCKSWPVEARSWIDRPSVGNWPSVALKRLAVSKGCFLVPVASKRNNLTKVEWRISTSMAERLLMFDLNITQIHCYVVLKYISKTYLQMNEQTLITSFMCKCTLFHCIESTPSSLWREDNLFPCVMHCLIVLHERVRELNCPHYIIPANNLMANRINDWQQRQLLNVMERLIQQNFDLLFAIEIDKLGQRLHIKSNNLQSLVLGLPSQRFIETIIAASRFRNVASRKYYMLQRIHVKCTNVPISVVTSELLSVVQKLQLNRHGLHDVESQATALIKQPLCAMVGSVLASHSVYVNRTVSPDALRWFSAGLDTDVLSVRLKLASAFYCAGDLSNAELTLLDAEQRYNVSTIPLCTCIRNIFEPHTYDEIRRQYDNNELLKAGLAFCVQFMQCEAAIIPCELRHELFRSTPQERQRRSYLDTMWMDLAVVDSLPYLYFLQYKVYNQQRRHHEKRKALSHLLQTVLQGRSLGHRETAWNLLGQCMLQEGMPVDALWCYHKSLEVRASNNAAHAHIQRLQVLGTI